jgi:hypothetical protein
MSHSYQEQPGIILTKEVRNFYNENKTPMKKLKRQRNRNTSHAHGFGESILFSSPHFSK